MIVVFFLIALVYASAGFGGGSLYISVLSQVFPGASWIRLPALLCNAAVTGVGSANFALAGLIPYRQVLQLLAIGLPMTMWAASWDIPASTFLLILGVMLVLAGVSLLLQSNRHEPTHGEVKNSWWLYPVVAAIGVLSGITGIGGGIYLSPFLHHSRWASSKAIAATTSVFILLNSIASIGVLLWRGVQWQNDFALWLVAVLLGGWLGSRTSIRWLKAHHLRAITAVILMFVGTKIWWDHWSTL